MARNKSQHESIEPCQIRPSTAQQEEVGWHGLAWAGIQCDHIPGWSTQVNNNNLLLSTTQGVVFLRILQGDCNLLQGQLQGTSCSQFTIDNIEFCN